MSLGETLDIAAILSELRKQKREIERAIAALEGIKQPRKRARVQRRNNERVISIVRGVEKSLTPAAKETSRKGQIIRFPIMARRAR